MSLDCHLRSSSDCCLNVTNWQSQLSSSGEIPVEKALRGCQASLGCRPTGQTKGCFGLVQGPLRREISKTKLGSKLLCRCISVHDAIHNFELR